MEEKRILQCEHENSMVFVKKEMSNGNFMLRKQCSFCGYVQARQLSQQNINMNNIPLENEFKKHRRDELKEIEYWKLREDGNTEAQKAYREYLKTDKWKEISDKRFKLDNGICVLCKDKGVDVHHHTYARKENEDLRDLITVCKSCHSFLHNLHGIEIVEEEKEYF